MLAPESGRFVDGNPNGGTIVAAAFMNAVLGEFSAILKLGDVDLQTSGNLPTDHQQVADLLAIGWARVQESGSYPENASDNAVLIDPAALIAGEWPFRIWRNGAWEVPEAPLNAGNDSTSDDDGDSAAAESDFDDAQHGQRGGGDLHSLATSTQAGFLSPEGYEALVQLSALYPRRFDGDWFSVQSRQTYIVEHGLEALPHSVEIWFREKSGVRRLTHSLFSPQQRFCGASVANSTTESITIVTGDRAWAGYTVDGFQEFSSGEYLIQAHG